MDQRFNGGKNLRQIGNSRSKNYFVCGRSGCWSAHHLRREGLLASRKKTSIRHFIVLLQEHQSQDEDEEVAEVVDDLIGLLIQIDDLDEQV